ncbi:MAG TPA: SPFH domain-containing protein [Kofleriaceae bacterium]|nr:SPFH domain-containing protein [Kofleriaceae bacterium]
MTPDQMIVMIAAGGVVLLGALLVGARSYRSVPQGMAMIVNRPSREPLVTFSGALVLPIVHRAEVLDVSIKQLKIALRGKRGLICKDNLRADLELTFFVRVNKTIEDVLRVAQSVGCTRASDPGALEELFTAKFTDAVMTAGKQLELEELFRARDVFRDQILAVIGWDLNGYVLDDVAIDTLEQTPIEELDPNNVLDAQGIRKIRSLTEGVERVQGERASDRRGAAAARLRQLGLLDVRVAVEVSCDVSPGREPLTLAIDGAAEAVMARLPPEITASVVTAAGRGELAIGSGRATFRWADPEVDDDQIVAAARLVHALRGDPGAYR